MIRKLKDHKRMDSSLGFTLLEIIAILVILGIISAVAVSRVTDTRADDLAAANTLKAHLRYAQLRTMGDMNDWGIKVESGSYILMRKDDNGTWKEGCWDNNDRPHCLLPGENSFEKSFEKTSVTSGAGVVGFSAARGQPTDSNGDLLSSGLTITVGSRTITITAETGFIQ